MFINEDSKVFVKGRVSEEEDKQGKLICEKIVPFGCKVKELWIQFEDKDTYLNGEKELLSFISQSEGEDEVVIYCKKERIVKRLPRNKNIKIDDEILARLKNRYSEKNIKVLEKSIENKI